MGDISDDDIRKLVAELDRGRDGWIHGNPALDTSAQMVQSPDMTIFGPFGGEALRNSPEMAARQAKAVSQFHGGTGKCELVEAFSSGDLLVLVMIERNEVRFSPNGELQPWILRTTQAFRRDGDRWLRLHRHADPLIKFRPLAETAAIARGETA